MDKTAGLGKSCGQALWPGEKKKKTKSLHNIGQALPLKMRCCFGYGGEETHWKGLPFYLFFSVLVSLKDPILRSVLLY